MCVNTVGLSACLIWLMGRPLFVPVQQCLNGFPSFCLKCSISRSPLQWLHKHSHSSFQTNSAVVTDSDCKHDALPDSLTFSCIVKYTSPLISYISNNIYYYLYILFKIWIILNLLSARGVKVKQTSAVCFHFSTVEVTSSSSFHLSLLNLRQHTEWRAQTHQVEPDYNKHLGLLPHSP